MACIFQNKPCVFFPAAFTLEIFSFSDLHIIYKAQKSGLHFRQNKSRFFIVIFLGISQTFCNFGVCFPSRSSTGGGILIS